MDFLKLISYFYLLYSAFKGFFYTQQKYSESIIAKGTVNIEGDFLPSLSLLLSSISTKKNLEKYLNI